MTPDHENDELMPSADESGWGDPADDAIRLRAYCLYLERERVGREGNAIDDWLQAEAELTSEEGAPRQE